MKAWFLAFLIITSVFTGIILVLVFQNAALNQSLQDRQSYDTCEGQFSGFYTYATENGNLTKSTIVTVNCSEYAYYKYILPHPSHSSTSFEYALNTLASYCIVDTIITSIALFISNNCTNTSSSEEVTNAVLSFCQDWGENISSLRYVADNRDLAKFPVETLCEQSGDCEDHAILFLAMMKALNYTCALLLTEDHAFAAIRLTESPTHSNSPTPVSVTISGQDYWVCETTGYGWRAGDLPADLENATVYAKIV